MTDKYEVLEALSLIVLLSSQSSVDWQAAFALCPIHGPRHFPSCGSAVFTRSHPPLHSVGGQERKSLEKAQPRFLSARTSHTAPIQMQETY